MVIYIPDGLVPCAAPLSGLSLLILLSAVSWLTACLGRVPKVPETGIG